MRLQTDQEFTQNEIKHLSLKHKVEMFITCVRSGKAFAAKQEVWELKLKLSKKNWKKTLPNQAYCKSNKKHEQYQV